MIFDSDSFCVLDNFLCDGEYDNKMYIKLGKYREESFYECMLVEWMEDWQFLVIGFRVNIPCCHSIETWVHIQPYVDDVDVRFTQNEKEITWDEIQKEYE